MIARVIVQTNEKTGETHVTFIDNPQTPTGEALVTAPGWENSKIVEGRVLILSMDESSEHVDALMETELHSARIEQSLSPVDQAVKNLLEGSRNASV
jgi:hypothetical protein